MDGHLHFLEVKNNEIFKKNTWHISTKNVRLVPEWVGNLEKFGFEPKKVCMESFDGCGPCLTSVNRSKSVFFSAEKANSDFKRGIYDYNCNWNKAQDVLKSDSEELHLSSDCFLR